ncbi:DUF4260 domain-containing protein [Microvirga sp. W0021]|uniref:DUF4260 domain-containing protein n=1 Tax=Hohaiivirga grylli TaxID=3133970 RepID=A0ABV0BK28_9HYPH
MTGQVGFGAGIILRFEAAALFVILWSIYFFAGYTWPMFAILFFVPDLSFFAYFAGRKVGAIVYNAMHTLFGPFVLGAIGYCFEFGYLGQLSLIWAAHIAFDRVLGYGLKSTTSFHDTHLGRIGRKKDSE